MKANRIAPLVVLLFVAGCVPSPPAPPPTPRPPVASRPAPPPPAPPAPADWRDAPASPGTWTWANEAGRSTARYGLPARPSLAVLACDPVTRTTNLWRTGAAGAGALLVVTATSARRALTGSPAPSGGLSASLPANDPLLDAIAFSRGRFMLETPGNPPLYLPSWPELSRVVEDCRKG